MPLLAGLLGSLFGSIVQVLATFLTKKAAFATAAVAVFATLTLAMTAVMAGLITSALSTTTLSAPVLQGMAMFMPANLLTCVAAIFSAEATAAVYRWNRMSLVLTATI